MQYFLSIYCFVSEGTPKIIHCSNVHDEWHEWPQQRVLGFSNSPTCTSLAKVKAGRKQFEEIIRQKFTKDLLVESLMELLKDRSRFFGLSDVFLFSIN